MLLCIMRSTHCLWVFGWIHLQQRNTEESLSAFWSTMDVKSAQFHASETQYIHDLSQWRQKEASLESEIERLQVKNREKTELMASMSNDKVVFERKLHEMEKEIKETRKLLQEKDDLVNSLQERVDTLEQRLSDTFLSGDDQHIALQVERDLLEQKLSEARLQLTEVKAAHSDKISDLERQIKDLKFKLLDAEKRFAESLSQTSSAETLLRKQVQDLENELSEQKTKAAEREAELGSRLVSIDLQVRDLDASRKLEKDAAESRITLLERQADVSAEMETKLRLKITEMEGSVDGLQKELVEKNREVCFLRQQLQDQETAGNEQDSTIEENELLKAKLLQSTEKCEEMSQTIAAFEAQMLEKNRILKKQEQTLKDLRVTLQRELKVQSLPNDEGSDMTSNNTASNSPSRSHKHGSDFHQDLHQHQKQYLHQQSYQQPRRAHVPDPMSSSVPAVLSLQQSSASSMMMLTAMSSSVPCSATDALRVHTSNVKRELDKDINFLYLKHVVLKFMLSRESEALQLIKAVSMLLNFTHQEQQLIKDTLEYKMSWFGHRPPVGKGQTSKIIPPAL